MYGKLMSFTLEESGMKKESLSRTTVIGAGKVGSAVSVNPDKDSIHQVNSLFWNTNGNEVLGTTALPLYGAFVSEENHHLFGDVAGKKLLEIGCGGGHSLLYHAERNASELWGIDIAMGQLEKAKQYLAAHGVSAHLICAPMEEEGGIPTDYFDFVYSVYAIGWTTDLDATFSRIASYLKKDGRFLFSWSHPIHKCVVAENHTLTFQKCYFDESWYSVSIGQDTLALSDRMLSTYINALAKAGFIIEQMIEQPDDEILQASEIANDFVKKAIMLPVTFVLKARKL
jgi:SAM-dependent methyltransferase